MRLVPEYVLDNLLRQLDQRLTDVGGLEVGFHQTEVLRLRQLINVASDFSIREIKCQPQGGNEAGCRENGLLVPTPFPHKHTD